VAFTLPPTALHGDVAVVLRPPFEIGVVGIDGRNHRLYLRVALPQPRGDYHSEVHSHRHFSSRVERGAFFAGRFQTSYWEEVLELLVFILLPPFPPSGEPRGGHAQDDAQ